LRLRASLRKLDLLILDELGYVPASKAVSVNKSPSLARGLS
jgi:DNA replication protein DnaC